MSKRSEAKARGDTHYFTGKPCPKGHVAERFTSSGGCTTCLHERGKTPERVQCDKDYSRENKDKITKRSKEYYQKNKQRRKDCVKKWQSENIEKVRLYKRNNKHKRRQIEGKGISWSELRQWEKSQPKVCHWCGVKCEDEYHVDHYIPLTKGGKHDTSNLFISCKTCNLKKSSKLPEVFAAEIGRLL